MHEERVYTESEVRAIVLVERADARYEAMREMVNLARTGEIKARDQYFKVQTDNR
jgi:hypothetical protein